MNDQSKQSNRLIHASSPYLLQHAYNPVDWWEWSDAAFDKARREDKLVLVSIGYASCHWCHVMAHESFEDEQTAALMNDLFVCIKVDREERPDIDQYCMDAVQLITGSGGWPLNCFLLPDGRPIHGGTYFKRKDWQNVLASLAVFYRDEREQSLIYATQLTSGVKQVNELATGTSSTARLVQVQNVLEQWSQHFDQVYGGFNWAPKFPMPVNLSLFLDYAGMMQDEKFKNHVLHTLTKMADGGIFDQLGGGFARYSTDAYWKVPHFEKMLYDNAQLMSLYAHASIFNHDALYANVIEAIHQFVQHALTSEEGLFYSSMDADSEGVEGLFYCWTKQELVEFLGEDEAIFSAYYQVEENGNWEEDLNILLVKETIDQFAIRIQYSVEYVNEVLERCKQKLLLVRAKRIHPATDDKIILSWNALMIKGYADAYGVTNNPEYLKMAERAMDGILIKMCTDDQLYRIRRAGKNSVPAFADDYASLIEALLSLYETTGNEIYAHQAKKWMQISIDRLYHNENGLFNYSALVDQRLHVQQFEIKDDVIPSSNGMFGRSLLKLGFLFDRPDFHQLLDQLLTVIAPKMREQPTLFPSMWQLVLYREKGYLQLLSGQTRSELKMNIYHPGVMYCKFSEDTTLPLLQEKKKASQENYYICRDYVCQLPVDSMEKAEQVLISARV